MRGDRPAAAHLAATGHEFTPHARGSTFTEQIFDQIEFVYPACAGIDPYNLDWFCNQRRLPRMRGDRPSTVLWLHRLMAFTPHARGSTPPVFSSYQYTSVYPACAGIDPLFLIHPMLLQSLPRMRGDRPCHI